MILGFDPAQAERSVLEAQGPATSDLVKLLYLRDLAGVSTSDPAFVAQQEKALVHLESVLSRQLATGGWLPLAEDRKMHKFVSTPQILIFLGYLGLDGTAIPEIARAVDYCFSNLNRDGNGLFVREGLPEGVECEMTMLWWALLRLGFAGHPAVGDGCRAYLDYLRGQAGMHCMHHAHLQGRPCVDVQVKDLLMLNEFPEDWRDHDYREIVGHIQQSLLARDLMEEGLGSNWLRFGTFRSHYSSAFECAEALALSGVRDHPQLVRILQAVGARCVDHVTWKAEYVQSKWPMRLEGRRPSPWLSLRGLKIVRALARQ